MNSNWQRLALTATIAAAALVSLTGCVVHHHDDGGYAQVDVVDTHGWHHQGYYDEHHDWHGGYYDDNHQFHDDPHDWHQ